MLIMDYLQVSRQASEGRRAARLSRGPNYFVEAVLAFSTLIPPIQAVLPLRLALPRHPV
jgi:hypothetical protein